MMAALATIIMLLGGVIPVMTYCSPLFASLCLLPVMDRYGTRPALATWAVVAALTLIIGLDKEAAFFWTFLAWYPAAKPRVDGIKSKPVRLLVKIGIFTVCTLAMYGLTCYILGIDEIIEGFSASKWINAGFIAAIVLVMMLYDRALDNMPAVFRKILGKTK